MEIQNLMEEVVFGVVDELFAIEEADHNLGFCTCPQCRLDVVCYVLNRVKPQYIVSSRGLAYRERDFLEKVQLRADIIVRAKEGWAQVEHNQRPNIDHSITKVRDLPEGPVFNMPAIMGRAFNGVNFAPVAEGSATLFLDSSPCRMIDANWQNPFIFAKATAGNFILRPRAVAAASVGEKRHFSFELKIESPGLEPLSHHFELNLEAESEVKEGLSLQNVHTTPDLCLFPK